MPKTILVVDDNDGVRRVISEILRVEGYLIESAASGAEALEAIRRIEPDVIVLDMMMPDMAGVEALRTVRREGVRSRIVAVSGMSYLLEAAKRAGADEILLKPMSPQDLVAAIERVLGTGATA